jgi:hypothetical protein
MSRPRIQGLPPTQKLQPCISRLFLSSGATGLCLVNFDQSPSPLSLNIEQRHPVPVDETTKLEPKVTRPAILVSKPTPVIAWGRQEVRFQQFSHQIKD